MKNSTKLAFAIVGIAVLAGVAVYFGNTTLQKGSITPTTPKKQYTGVAIPITVAAQGKAGISILKYTVKPGDRSGKIYTGAYAGMLTINNNNGSVKFVIQPGEAVNFVAFVAGNIPKDAMQKWSFDVPPYKNFSAIDGTTGKLCQVKAGDFSENSNQCVKFLDYPITEKPKESTPVAKTPEQPTPPKQENLPDLKIGKISTNFKDGDLWFFVEVRNEGDTNSCAKNFKVKFQGVNAKGQAFEAVLPKSISSTYGGSKEPVWEKDLCHYTTLDGVKGVNFVFTQPHYDFVKLQAFIDTGKTIKESDDTNNSKIVEGSLGWIAEE